MKENKNIIKVMGFIIIILLVGILFLFSESNNNVKTLSSSEIKTTAESVIKEFLLKTDNVKFEVKNVTLESDLYKLALNVNDQEERPLYMTRDGKKIILELIDIQELKDAKKKATEDAKIIKSDKPIVELFVMSYCPFGTQIEKGYLPAVEKLGNKIDTKVKFVNYIMHEQKEADENVRQYCIQENEPAKFNSYLSCFLEKGESENCQNRIKIDKKQLTKCVRDTDQKFTINKNMKNKDGWLNGRFPKFMLHNDLNKKYGVQGSPTLVINGKKVEGQGRDAQSVLNTICGAFNNPPAECQEKLSDKAPSAGFGYKEGASQAAAASCGA